MALNAQLSEGDVVGVLTISNDGRRIGAVDLSASELDDMATAATAIAAALRAKPSMILPRHLDPGATFTGPGAQTYTVIAALNHEGGELRYALALAGVASTQLMSRRDLADYANANGFTR
jgi:hypothetical protein